MRGVVWRVLLLVVACATLLLAGTAARAAPVVLYDGTVAGETPADQGFLYGTDPPAAAAEVRSGDGGTTLDTTARIGDLAGYIARPEGVPALSRAAGFTLRFTTQVISETHTSADRAGLSVLVLADDLRGIELGLWQDEIWAQNDGPAIFTHGEGAAIDLAARPVAFTLVVRGERYRLAAGDATVLEGRLRDYSSWPLPIYRTPRLIYLGDNTSRASAIARILHVSLEPAAPPPTPVPTPAATSTPVAAPPRVFLPLVSEDERPAASRILHRPSF